MHMLEPELALEPPAPPIPELDDMPLLLLLVEDVVLLVPLAELALADAPPAPVG